MTNPETPKENEIKINWRTLEEYQEAMVVMAHAAPLRTKKIDLLRRIFSIGNPEIIFAGDFSYCRIAAESVDLMKMLIKKYLR